MTLKINDEQIASSKQEPSIAEQILNNDQEKPMTNGLKFRNFLKEHLTNEMFIAIQEIFYSTHLVLKLFLVFFLILAYVLASYTTLKLIFSYFDYSVTSSVRNLYENPATFPKVTICNVNQFTTKYAYKFMNNISNFTFENFPINATEFERLTYAFIIQQRANALINDLNDGEKKRFGEHLDDSLLSCTFNLRPCSPNDFSWHFDSNYGNCYSFNAGFNSTGSKQDPYVSFIGGSFHGLILDFYVRSYERFSFFNSFWGGKGALVRIENTSHIIDQIKDGIFVMPGTSTHIALNREFKNILPEPYSSCLIDSYDKSNYFNSDLYQLIKNSPYDYTQNFCLIQCFNKLIVDTCGCLLTSFRSLTNNSFCFTFTQISCANNAYWNVYLQNDYIQNVCLPKCPLECYSTKFTHSTSIFDVHGDLYVNKIQINSNLALNFVTEQINVETVAKSFVRLNVFYDSLSYSITEEAPQWDAFSLIANIGGNLGLFLGVSFFSLCEILTTLIEFYFLRKMEQNKINI